MAELFWQRWSKEYMQRLIGMSKWYHRSRNLAVGDVVLITDERYPPSKWPLARVSDVHPGADGLVRVVTVRVANGSECKRPVVKLCPLPVDENE